MKRWWCRFWPYSLLWGAWAAFAARGWWDSTHDRVWRSAGGDEGVYAWDVGGLGVLCVLLTAVIANHRRDAARRGAGGVRREDAGAGGERGASQK